ncbi:hypothetical protein CRV15_28990 (plasmid) [Streptomyces clavuligerus]|uniref:Uncharacterized protein n=1 Tax=Streptomyces clavuligerus TaxID=1901 RepID=B5GUF7_STRCL|nr:hypothetical protein SSCG_03207 [Streptomyces clavuligerus]EFG03670.1 Hypothetical protein SCLAV_p0179 [Streptomyces clavuligerus]QCS09674.1 hypothetical protein CRV15_28990 [Streptomyces clavuligerus]QPJ98281.1 hypothetical protein GE265_35370 [Streptomyces clavuligerus]
MGARCQGALSRLPVAPRRCGPSTAARGSSKPLCRGEGHRPTCRLTTVRTQPGLRAGRQLGDTGCDLRGSWENKKIKFWFGKKYGILQLHVRAWGPDNTWCNRSRPCSKANNIFAKAIWGLFAKNIGLYVPRW